MFFGKARGRNQTLADGVSKFASVLDLGQAHESSVLRFDLLSGLALEFDRALQLVAVPADGTLIFDEDLSWGVSQPCGGATLSAVAPALHGLGSWAVLSLLAVS